MSFISWKEVDKIIPTLWATLYLIFLNILRFVSVLSSHFLAKGLGGVVSKTGSLGVGGVTHHKTYCSLHVFLSILQ